MNSNSYPACPICLSYYLKLENIPLKLTRNFDCMTALLLQHSMNALLLQHSMTTLLLQHSMIALLLQHSMTALSLQHSMTALSLQHSMTALLLHAKANRIFMRNYVIINESFIAKHNKHYGYTFVLLLKLHCMQSAFRI